MAAEERQAAREIEERRSARWDVRVFGGLLAAVVVYLYLTGRSSDANHLLEIALPALGAYALGRGKLRDGVKKEDG